LGWACKSTRHFVEIFISMFLKRRYERSWHNFSEPYKPLADSWVILDTSGDWPIIVDESGQPNEKT